MVFSSVFGKKKRSQRVSRTPDGQCAYVIGDVHGCLVELKQLLNKIVSHSESYRDKEIHIVFLGDLIDRGPDSQGVIEYLMNFHPEFAVTHFLMGNHEEVFLKVLDEGYEDGVVKSWFSFGGKECARSYNVDNLGEVLLNPMALSARIQRKVPEKHKAFIESFSDYLVFGDYLFVHAGIMPNVPLEQQRPSDLRWIRKKFLNYTKPHPYKVVHGHSIVEEPEIHDSRIAVDTGAYKGGPLTALFANDDGTEFIQS